VVAQVLSSKVAAAGTRKGVILLHGLARTSRSMRPLDAFLTHRGYQVVNVGYPSCRHPVEVLAQEAIPPAVAALRRQQAGVIHFVTHSMGGILLRAFLASEPLPELGRTVMLCPPNQGSELVDHFGRFSWFRMLFGPAGCQLGTGQEQLPSRLGPAAFPVGILTGNRPGIGLGRFFPGPSDGRVSVVRAQLTGMRDFLVLPYGHALIMRHRAVLEQVAAFLENGRFRRVD